MELKEEEKTSSDNLKPLREVLLTSAELLPNSVDHPFHSLPLVPFSCHSIQYFCFSLSSPLLPFDLFICFISGVVLVGAVVEDRGRAPPCHWMFASNATGRELGGVWHLPSEQVLTRSLQSNMFYNVVISYS